MSDSAAGREIREFTGGMDAHITASQPLTRGDRSALLSAAASWLSGVLAVIATLTSLFGLAADWPYAMETDNWRLQAQGQDAGNLLAVAVLIAGLACARRGSLRGLLLWVGALLYLGYTFVLYAVTIHFGPLFPAYVACLGLAAYALILTLTRPLPAIELPARAARTASVVLLVIGVCFALLWLSSIVGALVAGHAPAEILRAGLPSNPVHVLDLALVLPAMLMTAINTRRGSPPARFLLAPWLVFSTLIAASLVAVAAFSGGPLALAIGFLVVAALSGGAATLVLRGVPSQRDSVPSS